MFRQMTSNSFQTCGSRIALCISCKNEVKKCFGKVFGWISALNRWLISRLNSEQVDTLCICGGVSARGVLEGGGHFGPEEKIYM